MTGFYLEATIIGILLTSSFVAVNFFLFARSFTILCKRRKLLLRCAMVIFPFVFDFLNRAVLLTHRGNSLWLFPPNFFLFVILLVNLDRIISRFLRTLSIIITVISFTDFFLSLPPSISFSFIFLPYVSPFFPRALGHYSRPNF